MQGGHRLLGAGVQPAAHHPPTGQLGQQGTGPVCRRQGGLEGESLLEAAAGLGAQAHAAGRLAHQLGGEHRRLQPDCGGGAGHGLPSSTDHPGQGNRPVGIGHREGSLAERAFLPIQAGEALAGTGLAQPQGRRLGLPAAEGRQPLAIKGVQRLACFQHHQIGDVHDRVDRADAGLLQPPLQPGWRRAGPQPLQGRHSEQSALLHGLQAGRSHRQRSHLRHARHRREVGAAATEGRHLTGDALHRQSIRPVCRDRQLQHLVVQAQSVPHRRAQGRHGFEQLVQFGDAL